MVYQPLLFTFLMAKENLITQESFDVLLSWLDRNRETAAQKYEKIRQRLIHIFAGRGCFEAEELADETFNRVTRKMPQLADGYTGEPALYFYGVADKIHLEWLRKQKKIKNLEFTDTDSQNIPEPDLEYDCLETCLQTLSLEQRELIIEYYKEEKSAKISCRKELAQKLEIGLNALQIRTSRIRARLQGCIQKCVAKKDA